jgi:dipeptidyl-peptidase-4
MKKIGIIIICLCFALGGYAQEKMLELRDCVNPRTAYSDRKRQLNWRGDGDTYCYVDYGKNALIEGTVDGEESELLNLTKLNGSFEEGAEKLQRFPGISWQDADHFRFTHTGNLFSYNVKNSSLKKLASMEEGATLTETSSAGHAAYQKDHILTIAKSGSEQPFRIAEDGSREITYGEAAHRFEFGITKGLFWSPAGNKLAFYRVDRTMVTDYPLVDYTQTPATLSPSKYPMAGQASHHAQVGIYDGATDKVLYLKTGEPKEQYLTNITWSPDGKTVYVAIVNRDQNHMKLTTFDAASGEKKKLLFEEKQEKYVEPEHGPIFCFKNNPNEFLWFSERDGYDHLYLYDSDGNLKKQVTTGDWEVTEVLGTSADEKTLYIMATKESPLERHAYALELSSGKMKKLTKEKGTHRCSLSANGKYLIDGYSSRKVPYVQQVVQTKNGKVSGDIHKADNPIVDYKLGKMEFVEFAAKNGMKLYGRLIKPVDFDATKKYPVITYTYNGPHVQLVTESWNGGAQLFLHYLASQGYVVFTVDGRGSAHRGLGFEQEVFRQMGTKEVEDQIAGAEYLKSMPWVDADRMGVYGWSYGGFMTTSLMLRRPGAYKVGVAGGPVIDWKFYEVMYTERYMDTPEANPEGYAQASLLNYVGDLEGRLLIIHGLQDATVVPQHTRALLRKSVEAGKQLDYYAYPAHEHNVRGWDRVHLLDKIARYFNDFL